jgi:hypothetical protein
MRHFFEGGVGSGQKVRTKAFGCTAVRLFGRLEAEGSG